MSLGIGGGHYWHPLKRNDPKLKPWTWKRFCKWFVWFFGFGEEESYEG